VKVAIVYDSSTGTTKAASEAMKKAFEAAGHECSVDPVQTADPAKTARAELVCLGSWTKGLFFVLQKPTPLMVKFAGRMPDLTGKKAIVFCTYKVATGKALSKLAQPLAAKGAGVIGRFRFRGPMPSPEFDAFVRRLTS
jgi:flavodoxin